MKVVILCGGEGTRMREETEFRPKALVEVGGKPIIWHIMKIYARYGFNEFILTLGYKGNMIKDYFLNARTGGSDFTYDTKSQQMVFHGNSGDDFKVTFVDTGLKSGTGERVRRVAQYVDGDDFMVTYGDGVADIDIGKLLDFHKHSGAVGTVTGVDPITHYGVITVGKDQTGIRDYAKTTLSGAFKTGTDVEDYFVNGGFMVFKRGALEMIPQDSMIEDFFPTLARMGQLSMFKHIGRWKSMDTLKDADELNEYWVKDPFWKIWDNPTPATIFSNSVQNHLLRGKNVLVTGGTGLVGAHLVEKLLELGAKVTLTQRSTKADSYFYRRGLGGKVANLICDIKDPVRVKDAITKSEAEYVFHIAAQPVVPVAFINPYEVFNTNIMGTVNVLEACRLSPLVKGIVVASSDKAYGKNSINAREEDPVQGDHPYDVSKSCTDLISFTYNRTYGLPVAVSRFGNIYGPGDLNFNRIIPGIMKSIIMGVPLELRSDGTFIRDYVYVKDVVDGYIKLMENIDTVKGEAFNFSSGFNFSVLELIGRISDIVGKRCEYHIVNNQKNEIPKQSLNYEKAMRVLGWRPSRAFEEGIRETYEWYKEFNYA